jgi:hypothetical protein
LDLDEINSQLSTPSSEGPSPEHYCREIEGYLCRKNDGHLIRIVGPSFETVCSWAARGVPIKVAYRGIDRYFERYYAKGPRRRPVRIDFCEADVLDVFDEWRRALGITAASAVGSDAGEESSRERTRPSLPAHLDRAIARLTVLRAGPPEPEGRRDRTLDALLDDVIRELDAARSSARSLRGDARVAFLARLAALDARLLDAARDSLPPAALEEVRHDASEELAPFRERMPRDAFDQALAASTRRLIRERKRLPVLILE